MSRLTLLLAPLVFAGCSDDIPDAKPLPGGELYVSPLGFKVYWFSGSVLYPTPTLALEEVDRQAHNYLAEFGGVDPYRLNGPLDSLRLMPIKLWPSYLLPGGDRPRGRCWYGIQVDVAMDSDFYDTDMARQTFGLMILVHEFRHVIKGEWHP